MDFYRPPRHQKFLLILSCTTAAFLTVIFIYFQTTIMLTQNELVALRNQLRELLETSSGVTKRSTDMIPTAHQLLAEHLPAVEVVQFIGVIPNLQIKQHGKIGPWRLDKNTSSFDWVFLKANSYNLEVSKSGLYFLYAQIYYLTTEPSNSFEVIRITKDTTEMLSLCANQVSPQNFGSPVEISCYTGVVVKLNPGDQIYLNQIEQNRFILCSPGYSHWGVIKLN